MPSSHRRFAPGHFPLQRLSRDLILEIFAWCAPMNLVILRSASRNIKAILDQRGNHSWTRARSNLLWLPAVPTCLKSEIAFINFFNPGCNRCLSSSRSVDNAFPNLTYRIYLCKDVGCVRIHAQTFLIGDMGALLQLFLGVHPSCIVILTLTHHSGFQQSKGTLVFIQSPGEVC
ncbi:hypothetical protein EDD85DRAFT_441939 [Armillaria nabsnona]|nr:hypothetical protein EDD85DRAFT_441939 [Armillaria nabsnona]